MATISSSIRLMDNMTPAISSMMRGMNSMIAGFESMERASKSAIDTKAMSAAKAEMAKAAVAVNQFEKELKQATDQQEKLNQSAKSGGNAMSGLAGKIGGAVAAYATLQGAQKVLTLSDQYTQTTARLDLMNDGLQSTEELQDKIFKSAQDSRGLYTSTADAVSKMGLMAKDAFSSNTETIDFMEQINKQFVMSGTSAQGAEAATLQLTQAMAGGVLRGEELNSIFENAPTIIQSIAKYMNVPIGKIRKMAEEGELTADVVKKAMFATANETNKKFNAMPKTFNQVWNSFSNVASKSFQGVFNDLSDLANSPELENFLNAVAGGISGIAGVVSGIGAFFQIPEVKDLIADVGTNFGIATETFKSNMDQIAAKIKEKSPEMIQSVDETKASWVLFYDRITADNEALKGIDWQDGLASAMEVEAEKLLSLISLFSNLGTIMTDVQNMKTAFWKGPAEFKEAAIAFDQDLIKMGDNIAKTFQEAPDPSTVLASGMEANKGLVDAAAANMVSAVSTPLAGLTTNATAAGNTIGLGVGSSVSTGMTTGFQVGFAALPYSSEQAGQQATAGFIAGALGNQAGIADAGKTSAQVLIDSTNSALQVNSPSKVFQKTGNYVGDGLIQGLRDRESQITAGGDAAATALKNSFKSALGINSPSTVFRDFGFYAIDGLIEGLSSSELMTFCEGIVQEIKDAFANNKFTLQTGIDFLGSGAPEFFKEIGVGGANLGDLVAPVAGGITSGFGYRDPFMTDSGQMSSKYHEGIDIGAGYGAAVGAAGAGQVTFAGDAGGYGNMVRIDHGGGLETMYAHLSSILVSVGEFVTKMQTIGLVGSTGNSTGAHLHFGLYQDGAAIDPSALFGGYASGTKFATRGLHLVGEKGPEIMSFAGGEKVLDADKSKQILNSTGKNKTGNNKTFAPIIKINMGDTVVNSDMDIAKVAKQIGKKLKDEIIISSNGFYEAV